MSKYPLIPIINYSEVVENSSKDTCKVPIINLYPDITACNGFCSINFYVNMSIKSEINSIIINIVNILDYLKKIYSYKSENQLKVLGDLRAICNCLIIILANYQRQFFCLHNVLYHLYNLSVYPNSNLDLLRDCDLKESLIININKLREYYNILANIL